MTVSKPGPGDRGVIYSRTDRALVLAATDKDALSELWEVFESGNIDKENNLTHHSGFRHIPAGTEVRIRESEPRGALHVDSTPAGTEGSDCWVLPENFKSLPQDPAADQAR